MTPHRNNDLTKILPFWAITITLYVATPAALQAETKAESQGLLVCGPIALAVEGLDRDGWELGLTDSGLESIAKSRMLAAGIFDRSADPFLYVRIGVVGAAFSLDLRFGRHMHDELISNHLVSAWAAGVIGVHGDDADHIKDALRDQLDMFVSEFLTVNNSGRCAEIRRQKREAAR